MEQSGYNMASWREADVEACQQALFVCMDVTCLKYERINISTLNIRGYKRLECVRVVS
jgi:hypothetical protein